MLRSESGGRGRKAFRTLSRRLDTKGQRERRS
jgi:hypothetical protein